MLSSNTLGSFINITCITVGSAAHVSVADQGIEISPKAQPHVFESFYFVYTSK